MPQPLVALLAEAARAGVVIVAEGGTLTVSGPAGGAALGRELVARKAEVLAHLAAVRWDGPAAVRLMEAADAAVERHGCRGADPAIQAAAARACEAYGRRDGDGLARACAEVARLAAAPDPAGAADQSTDRSDVRCSLGVGTGPGLQAQRGRVSIDKGGE